MRRNIPIESILTGIAKPLARGRDSAIDKKPVSGPVHIGLTGLTGDEQADTEKHGGPEKAVHIYSRDHYAAWLAELSSPVARDILQKAGAFGENISVSGLSEQEVCIGDIWQAGSAVLQVSQGRQPCWKLNERFAIPDMSSRVQDSGRTGWYFRVLEPGSVDSNSSLVLRDRLHETWSIARIAHIFYHDRMNMTALETLADIPELAESWRKLIQRRLDSNTVEDWSKRLSGS